MMLKLNQSMSLLLSYDDKALSAEFVKQEPHKLESAILPVHNNCQGTIAMIYIKLKFYN